ncbi:hypothetical protein [Microbacterium sp. BLY]|uniref:hypothetical protein n=1 Tax=Microbacterium sp. BLY TaxID=2823280 RepID=UPI001B329070|nr:hypothetical protein [Microbacterium sp. BLY]MBP3976248.1 hypothetical protein [Microbacterium sp. BLY]
MVELTAPELAERLGITRRYAIDLLACGAITGRQLPSGAWLADSDSVARYEAASRRGSGRRLEPGNAWALLWILSGLTPTWIPSSTLSRLRGRIRRATPEEIARAVSSRTTTHRYQAANAAKAAEGLIATGRAAAGQLGVGLMDDRRAAVGYATRTAAEYAKSRFMVESATGQHVVYDNTLPVPYSGDTMPLAVIAADLSVSTDTRERSAGLRALEELRARWLTVDTRGAT